MLTLFLMRHAKSIWPSGVLDIDRPLSERGRDAAYGMGGHMHEKGYIPQRALVSPALRTQQTWEIISSFLGNPFVHLEPRLYEASSETILEVIRETSYITTSLMVIGHNPGLEHLVQMLSKGANANALSSLNVTFPTCGLATLEFDLSHWKEVTWNGGLLKSFVSPKDLHEEEKL